MSPFGVLDKKTHRNFGILPGYAAPYSERQQPLQSWETRFSLGKIS